MADENQLPLPTEAPVVSPAEIPAPAAATVPLSPAPVAAAPNPEPVADIKVDTAIAEPVVEKSALASAAEKIAAAEKPAEVKLPEAVTAPVEQKKEEGSQSVDPAPLPSYEAFKLPDGASLDNARLGEFTKELGEFQNLTKADQAQMQEFGQKLVDRHVAEITRLNEFYANSWEKQKSDWRQSLEKDPEIGGNRYETSLNAAVEFVKTHGGTKEQQQEFWELMDRTGAGNNAAMVRLLAKANSAMSEGRPLPASLPMPQPVSKIKARYGKTN